MLTPNEQQELAELEAEFDAAGGRGVWLAERIDELRALAQELCPDCLADLSDGIEDHGINCPRRYQ